MAANLWSVLSGNQDRPSLEESRRSEFGMMVAVRTFVIFAQQCIFLMGLKIPFDRERLLSGEMEYCMATLRIP